MNNPAEFGYYVYAVGEAKSLAGLTELAGIDDAPVTLAVRGQVCGLTSRVGVDAFRMAQQPGAVTETSWLARAVRAHEQVALQALQRAPVLPMRFGTMYATAEDVAAMLQRHEATLLAELHRLSGATEWSLKVSLADTGEQPAETSPPTPSTGTAWLLSRQAALRARDQRGDQLAACVERLQAALATQAREVLLTRPASGAADIVRMWLLVDDAVRFTAAFEAARAHQSAAGCTLELTGPWPPYHFVRTEALRDDVRTEALRDDVRTEALRADPSARIQPAQPPDAVEALR
jgi:Gas vesicle synthesis protein GvpL/GvpF